MTRHNAEAPRLKQAEDADSVLADQRAANRAEEVLFMSKLTSESLKAIILNNDDTLRHVVADNLIRNFEHRMDDLEPQDVAQMVFDMLEMVAQEANHAVFELQQQRIADLQIRVEAAELRALEANERHNQLVSDVRDARATIISEFMEDEGARDIVRESLIGIENRPLIIAPTVEVIDEMVEENPTPAAVLRSLGSVAIQRSRKAMSRIKSFATGEMKESA